MAKKSAKKNEIKSSQKSRNERLYDALKKKMTPELQREMLSAIASQSKSFLQLKRENPHFLSSNEIFTYCQIDPDFRESLEIARRMQQEAAADEILAIADNEENDLITQKNGMVMCNSAKVARDALRIKSRTLLMSCLNPDRYKNRLEVVAKVQDDSRKITDGELEKGLEFLLAKATKSLDTHKMLTNQKI